MTNVNTASRYPLSWPASWKRTTSRRASQFGGGRLLTIGEGLGRLRDELRRLGAGNVVISTDVPTRIDGLPYASAAMPKDPGVAVYFTLKGQPRCLACDTYHRLPDNFAALAAHISALRAIERYGVGTLDQAFAGYTALPSPVADAVVWWDVLRVERSTATREVVQQAYRNLARQYHPDAGGSTADMTKITLARDAALREVRS